MRNIKFWGRNCLECLGMSAGAAIVLILFFGIGSGNIGDGGIGGMLLAEIALFPYYLVMAGAFVVLMVTISYFQLYFSILLSMNSTRRAAAGGIWLSTAAVTLAIIAAAGIIWSLLPGDLAESGISILPLLAGALFIENAVVTVMGVIVVRWGKAGMILLMIFALVCGGAAGAWTVLSGKTFEMLLGLSFNFYPVLAAGIVLYLLAGIFMVMGTRKLEVRL